MKSRRIYLAEHPKLLDQHLENCADRKAKENLQAVLASKTGQGTDGRIGSQPSGLERLRRFNQANGRAQG